MRRTAFLVVLGMLGAIDPAPAADAPAAAPASSTAAATSSTATPEMPRVCATDPRVTVLAPAPDDVDTACDGAHRALAFLARLGLDGPETVTVEIVPAMPGELAGKALGCYVPATKRILILSYAAFEAGGGWFRMPASRELYRAVAAHEVGHAVVGCQSEPRPLPVAAHEYVAYVVLFATMDPPLRAAILARFPGTGFRTSGQISDVAHVVNPNQFGVDAWRHFQRVADRERWLKRVIAGEVVPEAVADPGAEER